MMVTYVGPRKENFFGNTIQKISRKISKCGVSILTNQKVTNEVFNCFGVHSSFDTVAMLSFYLILSVLL